MPPFKFSKIPLFLKWVMRAGELQPRAQNIRISSTRWGWRAAGPICLTVMLIMLVFPVSLHAATLSLSPSTQTVAVNSPLTINVNLDTKGEKTTSTDVLLIFDPKLLEITSVDFKQPPLYTTNTKIIDNTTGKLRMTSTFTEVISSFAGSDNLATIHATTKAVGTASVVFTCEQGKTNETNVLKKGTTSDIVECGNLTNGSYLINLTGTGGTPATPSARPTLPQTGNIGPTGLFLIGGAALLGIGTMLVLLL